MAHGASPRDRLRSLGSAGSTVGGHVAVDTLLRRCRLLSTQLEPETIDGGWEDSVGDLWSSLAQSALGRDPGVQVASRADLFTMAKAAIVAIDALPARADWYPEGWQAIAAVIRGGGEKPREEARPAQRQSPRGDPRSGALNAVNYVACELGVSEDEVLRRIRRTKAKLKEDDVSSAMALLTGDGR